MPNKNRYRVSIDKQLAQDIEFFSSFYSVPVSQLVSDAFDFYFENLGAPDGSYQKTIDEIHSGVLQLDKSAYSIVERMDLFNELLLLFVRYFFAAHPRFEDATVAEKARESARASFAEFVEEVNAAIYKGGNLHEVLSIASAIIANESSGE